MASHPELEFFNTISGNLEIELDEPATPIGNLENLQASPNARVVRMTLKPQIYIEETEDFRLLTQAELDSVAFRGKSIKLRGEESETVVTHKATNGKHFTVQELLNAIEETERQTRSQTEWFGGIDVHHVFFEGIDEADDGVWEIIWGS